MLLTPRCPHASCMQTRSFCVQRGELRPGPLTFHHFVLEAADLHVQTAPFLLRVGFWCVQIRHSASICQWMRGKKNQLTSEGATLFISRRVNVREQSSGALRGNRKHRGQRPRRINHLPFLFRIRKDPIPQTYTDSSPRKRFTA